MKSYRNMTKSELLQVLEKYTAPSVTSSDDAVDVAIAALPNNDKEHFIVLSLNGGHKVCGTHVISTGLVNRTVVAPREVFRPAITDNAVAVILAHNHPSGSTEPSAEDDNVTEKIKKAGDVLGIPVLDHIIITETSSYSYLGNGKL